jgi:pyrimidine-specific ribonucleoside hydrolase
MRRCVLMGVAVLSSGLSLITWAHLDQGRHGGRVVFETFPRTADLFRPDVRPFVERIISRHGPEEWETVVLTSEFHTHLGIYSIVGAKMGLRAREYFGADLDGLKVTSWAGRTPPISCLTDGLQASTGATLGHGTIAVADSPAPMPKAYFTRGDTTICLELKPAYWQRVKDDIAKVIEQHGPNSDAYWSAVRQLGIRYWADWSRSDIFDLTVIHEK